MENNLVYIPYHDWRKILDEGNRTRDAHFIESFRNINDINKLIIVNRPVTRAELLIKKKRLSLKINGNIILSSNGCKLIQLDNKTFLIDFELNENLKHVFMGRKWYFEAFSRKIVRDFFSRSIRLLKIDTYKLISANIFAEKFITNGMSSKIMFDAWDNFILMPGLSNIVSELTNAYIGYSQKANIWITNSQENINYYLNHYNVDTIRLITNGVDPIKFQKKLSIPKDLSEIKCKNKPIVGFGGKISHLVDFELLNFITEDNNKVNFVLVGQILDRTVFSSIRKRKNVFYLGDKHYDDYAHYVTNFDMGIIPYVTENKGHGGDIIKAYEYLAAGIPVVASNGNGAALLSDYVNIANSKEEFSQLIRQAKVKANFPFDDYTWENKAKQILQFLNNQEIEADMGLLRNSIN